LFELITERRAHGSAPSTIARQLAAIRSLHRFLTTEDRRRDDPTADVEGVDAAAKAASAMSSTT
jgi:integrase/recombinase XerD